MQETNIDLEKDHLVIFRDHEGKFMYFHWYSASEHPEEKLKEAIIKNNDESKGKGDDGRFAEIILDPAVREICSYRERTGPYLGIIDQGNHIMDGIETRVFCPECRKELSLLLEKQEVPEMLGGILKMMNLPIGNETTYAGSTECACGKIIKIRFSIEAVSEDEFA